MKKKTTVQAGIVRVSVIGLILMVFLILLNIFFFFRKKVSSPLSQIDKALMAEQAAQLSKYIFDYKGDCPQTDDIALIAFKI